MLDAPRKITIKTMPSSPTETWKMSGVLNGVPHAEDVEVPVLRTRSGRIIRPGDVVTEDDPIVLPAQEDIAPRVTFAWMLGETPARSRELESALHVPPAVKVMT